MDLPETSSLWWTQHQQQQPMILLEPIQTSPLHHPPSWFNSQTHQNDNNIQEQELENDNVVKSEQQQQQQKEPMFEKPLTPSDVGKLNRLVIPKQHAEKYFPLGGTTDSGGESCKGLLLSFEDESGKCWRFRYSYWNSSQSYVLTKGWSRYVKDKRLDAGDVVLFERHRFDSQRLFINWRRRKDESAAYVSRGVGHKGSDGNGNGKNEVGVGWSRGYYSAQPYPAHHQFFPYQQYDECLHAGRGSQGQNQRTKQVGNSSSSSSSSRVLRLFGVNMECQPELDSTPECSFDSNNMPLTQGTIDNTQNLYQYHQPSSHSNSNSNSHPHHELRHQPYYY